MLFISYSREDRATVAKLIEELAAEGIPYVVDLDLAEGDPFWREVIANRLSHCHLMVCLASARADYSPWVEQEQRAFQGPKLRIAIGSASKSIPSHDSISTVPQDRAIRAIRKALGPHVCDSDTDRGSLQERTQADARALLVLEEQRRLSFFLLSPPANFSLDVEGINGVITNGFTELQVRSLPRPNETIFVTTLPITNRQYRIFLGQTGYLQPPTWQRPNYCEDDAPVTGVNWFEAATFAAWIGGALLTEEEWIAAARGKERTRTFATATGLIDDAAAYFGNAFASGAPKLPISHPPNPEGFYGLCGNTWDWCATPKGPHRAILGGGYMDSATFCRIDAGYRNAPIDRDCCVGFRVKASVA